MILLEAFPMGAAKLSDRVAALEADVARLKAALPGAAGGRWWEQILGAFAGDPAHEEAMRLGCEYRESLRPGRRKRRDADSGH